MFPVPGRLMTAAYDAFREADASLVEINPLIVTKSGDVLALDAKMTFDDNALFRHADIKELRDLTEEEPLEVEASKYLAQLHQAGRDDRLHGQRRRSRHGHDGHHQAGGRRAGKLPGRRRWRQRGADPQRVQNPDVR